MTLSAEANPAELSAPQITEIPGPWCVAKTKSRQEKALAHFLNEHKINYFLPLVQTAPKAKSSKPALKPLFEGVVFIAFPSANRWELDLAKSSRYVSCFWHTSNQARLVAELALLAKDSSVRLEPHFPRKGDIVRFTKPGMTVLEGMVAESDGQKRVYIDLFLLGQKVSVEVTDPSSIEVIK
jgi:hypothetical protein